MAWLCKVSLNCPKYVLRQELFYLIKQKAPHYKEPFAYRIYLGKTQASSSFKSLGAR